MAGDDWQVESVGGAPPAAPPQAAPPAAPAPSDDWQVESVGSPGAQKQTGATDTSIPHEGMVDSYLKNAPWWDLPSQGVNALIGMGAGVDETAAGLDTLAHKVIGTKEHDWLQKAGSAPVEGGAQKLGKTVEGVGEFFSGEELLGMLGRSAKLMSAGEKLKSATQLAGVLAKHPYLSKVLKIGMESVKAGGISGVQEYAKTGGDTEAAEKTGLLNAAVTGALGSTGIVGKALLDLSPVKKVLEGVPITALKSQINKFGKFVEGGDISDLAPKVAADQQVAAQQVIKNVASRATDKVLKGINETRKYFGMGEDPARLLPTPGGAPPFEFNLSGEALKTGEQTQSATDQEILETLGLKKVKAQAGGARLTPEEKMQYDAAWKRESSPSNLANPPTTANPAEATARLHDLDELRQSPDYADLPEAQRATIEQQYKTLSDQLTMYHSSPYRNLSAPLDIDSITPHVDTFGHAAAQIQGAIEPIFQKVRLLSAGGMVEAEKGVTAASQAIRNARTPEMFNSAVARFDEATDSVKGLLRSHAEGITRTDVTSATQAYGQAAKLQKLHAVFEHMMNGVTHEESEEGLSRVMTGNARNLQSWLNNSDNAKMLDDLVGKDTRTNLKELTLLMSKVTPQRHMAEGVKNIAKLLDPQKYNYAGALIGSVAGRVLGHGGTEGAAVGVGLAQGMRYVLRQAATNPKIGNWISYAVEHNIRPDVYAPLIARFISEGPRPVGQLMEDQGKQQGPQQGSQGDKPPPPTYDAGPLAGKPVEDMIKQGNVDVNHRIQITNEDKTGSSIFSVTVPLDKNQKAVPWEVSGKPNPAIANYALVPGIDNNGKFFTPDGKKPKGESYEGTEGEEKAAAYYNQTGQHLGIFRTSTAADKYAGQTHAWTNDKTDRKVYTPSY